MYAQLGNIIFQGLNGFTAFTDSRKTDFSEVAMVNTKPRLQRVGEALQELSISILLHYEFANVEGSMAELEQLREDAEGVPLVLGNGAVLGDFIILSIQRNIGKADALGNIIYLRAELKLKEAPGGDRLEEISIRAKNAGFASDITKVVPTNPIAIPPSAGALASASATSVNVQAVAIADQTEIALNNPSRLTQALAIISQATDAVYIAALDVANKMRGLEAEVSNALQIIADAEEVALLSSNVKDAALASDTVALNLANISLQDANNRLSNSTSTLGILIALRKF